MTPPTPTGEKHPTPSSHGGAHGTHAPAPEAPGRPPHSPAPANKPARTWAIGIILLAFVLIVGGLVIIRLTQTPSEPGPQDAKVQVKLLVDANCELCFKNNTILAKLEESKIAYEVETFDIHSPEGQALVSEFDIEYAPTALVNTKGLDQNSTIQAALQGQFISGALTVKKGWVIVPEQFLDKQPHLLTFFTKPEACTVPPGKIQITAHLDYGDCKPCRDAQVHLDALLEKYPSLTVDYEPIVYNRTTPAALHRAVISNIGAVCADKLGYMNPYTACNYFNTPFYGSLDINRMKSCLIEAGGTSAGTRNAFTSCIQDQNSGAETTLVNNTEAMHKWNPLKYTPSFVFDCTYSILGDAYLENILCSLHPELGCTIAAVDTNNSSTPGDANATETEPVDTNA